jgi:hypothetical protein
MFWYRPHAPQPLLIFFKLFFLWIISINLFLSSCTLPFVTWFIVFRLTSKFFFRYFSYLKYLFSNIFYFYAEITCILVYFEHMFLYFMEYDYNRCFCLIRWRSRSSWAWPQLFRFGDICMLFIYQYSFSLYGKIHFHFSNYSDFSNNFIFHYFY